MNKILLKKIINLLKSHDQPKWQTTESIVEKLDIDIQHEVLEKNLITHYKASPNSIIRYSTLPSKRSLQVLWGHLDKVGDRRLFDIFKEDEEEEASYLNNIEQTKTLFLSHSFKDSREVLDLAFKLVEHKLIPWIAEVDIRYSDHINNKVREAIVALPFFGIYLSKNVLQSTWSAKEFEFAIKNKRKLFAFIPEDEMDIIDLIESKNTNSNHNIHDLLKRIFDEPTFTQDMEFFLISEQKNLELNKIKPLNSIQYFI